MGFNKKRILKRNKAPLFREVEQGQTFYRKVHDHIHTMVKANPTQAVMFDDAPASMRGQPTPSGTSTPRSRCSPRSRSRPTARLIPKTSRHRAKTYEPTRPLWLRLLRQFIRAVDGDTLGRARPRPQDVPQVLHPPLLGRYPEHNRRAQRKAGLAVTGCVDALMARYIEECDSTAHDGRLFIHHELRQVRQPRHGGRVPAWFKISLNRWLMEQGLAKRYGQGLGRTPAHPGHELGRERALPHQRRRLPADHRGHGPPGSDSASPRSSPTCAHRRKGLRRHRVLMRRSAQRGTGVRKPAQTAANQRNKRRKPAHLSSLYSSR